MSLIKVSIIIPLYNGALLVTRCLDSVFNQKGGFDLEVIVIDDGSIDNSIEIVKQYPKPITLLQQSNSGPAAARNKGIKSATGKYLAFLDADDYWMPEFLQKTAAFLETHTKAIAVSVGQIHKIPRKPHTVAPKILEFEPKKFTDAILLDDFYSFWAEHNHVCTGSVLLRSDVAKQTGGQRTELRITEDLEFWAYLATFGKWGFIPKVLFVSDGGEVTRQQGWMEKNRKRWASAPNVEEWEKRIILRIPIESIDSFNKVKGKIARNLVYSMILSGRKKMARGTVQKYKAFFPLDKLSKVMKMTSTINLLWIIFGSIVNYREKHRKF